MKRNSITTVEVLVYEPYRTNPYHTKVVNSRTGCRSIVGGDINLMHLAGPLYLVCCAESQDVAGCPNRAIVNAEDSDDRVIHGTFFVCRAWMSSINSVHKGDEALAACALSDPIQLRLKPRAGVTVPLPGGGKVITNEKIAAWMEECNRRYGAVE